jgi:multicomponent Na+:H+ antiporter subunit F
MDWINWVIQGAVLVMTILMAVCSYRLWVGPTIPDRLQAIDAVTTLLICIVVLLAVLQNTGMFIDVAIALAAFAFIGTLGMARYIAEGKVF